MSEDSAIWKYVNTKNIGKHIANVIELYLRPVLAYRKAVNYRKSSYDYVMLHIHYVGFFLFLFVTDAVLVVKMLMLEALLLLVPFLVLVIPFLVFRRLFDKRIQLNRLYRLLLIIKIQFLPFILVLMVLGVRTSEKLFFIILENTVGVMWLAFAFILPLLLKISWIQKGIWMICNYLFLNGFYLTVAVIAVLNINNEGLVKRYFNFVGGGVPSIESAVFMAKTSDRIYDLHTDKMFLLVGTDFVDGDTLMYVKGEQFVSNDLLVAFKKTEHNFKDDIRFDYFYAQYHQRTDTSFAEYERNVFGYFERHDHVFPLDEELTKEKLDSFRVDFNERFYGNLDWVRNEIKRTKHSFNKEYFESYLKYLEKFDSLFKQNVGEEPVVASILKLEGNFPLDTIYTAFLMELDSTSLQPELGEYRQNEREIVEFTSSCHLVNSLVAKPTELAMDELVSSDVFFDYMFPED